MLQITCPTKSSKQKYMPNDSTLKNASQVENGVHDNDFVHFT